MRRPERHTPHKSRQPQRPTRPTTRAGHGSPGEGAELRQMARWIEFHEQALMPARARGGAEEVRRVLVKARSDGLMNMSDPQIEQEIRDVMAAPGVTATR